MHTPGPRHAHGSRTRLVLLSVLATGLVLAGATAVLVTEADGDQPTGTVNAAWVHPTPSPSPSASPTAGPPSAPPPARSAGPSPAAPSKTGGGGDPADQVVTLVNRARARAGCRPLTVDGRLAGAALAHSTDMARRNYFSHDAPDGSDPAGRISEAGYRWSAYGENIAAGYADAASVMDGWMHSPGHRANILDCDFRNIGVGVAMSGSRKRYWTQDFGAPR